MSEPSRGHAGYGVDAPSIVRNMTLGGVAMIVGGFALGAWLEAAQPTLAAVARGWGLFGGLALLVTAGVMLWSSKVGKFIMRDRLLDALALRGDERVLDVGCGRGLLLLGAAKRLTTGKAVGVDIWRNEDQSDNRADATWANARAEGVADRVEIKDGDARDLPFADNSFDVIVSSLALHNIPDAGGRAQAIREIARVLKSGGRVAIFDVARTDEYARVLGAHGMSDVKRVMGLPLFMSPLARLVFARKPV
ncbi:MAG: class I SAM-dependent methyltransferase [Chloroflexota bacterium]